MPKYQIEVSWSNDAEYETDEDLDEEGVLEEIIHNGTLDMLCSGSELSFSCKKIED
jgi:hypothetical protein